MAEDPHQDVHEIAEDTSAPHPPVPVADGDDWKTALDKLNKTLTKRINDLRTDNDTFQRAVSASVQALTNEVKSAKTKIQNNSDAITAQDDLIDEAKAAAAAAKTVADAATAKAHQVEVDLGNLTGEMRTLEAQYAAHTHDVAITMQGRTTGPQGGN